MIRWELGLVWTGNQIHLIDIWLQELGYIKGEHASMRIQMTKALIKYDTSQEHLIDLNPALRI